MKRHGSDPHIHILSGRPYRSLPPLLSTAWLARAGFVLVHKAWIEKFARDATLKLRTKALCDEGISWKVRFVVGDNCDYHLKTVHEHVDGGGEYLHTVNWLSVWLRQDVLRIDEPLEEGGWRQSGFSRWSIRKLFDPQHPEVKRFKKDHWKVVS